MKSLLLGSVFLLASFIHAHPGPHAQPDPVHLARRGALAKRCSDTVGLMKRKRHAMRRRALSPSEDDGRGTTTYTITADAPKYDFLKNDTCILTPETSTGPYIYPRSQVLRQDIVEDQVGVPFVLDIGLMDIHTCEPLSNALVDIWHCNASGSYSSFTGLDPDIPFQDQYFESTGEQLPAKNEGESDTSFLATDNTTWLRGMWPTDDNGATSFTSIFPGFYTNRAIHVHLQVHTDWTITSNGTIGGSRTVNTAQLFFNEDVATQVMAVPPYAYHTQIPRKPVSQDGVWYEESLTGAMTIMDTEPLDGQDYANGVLGYITLGVDTTAIHNGTTENPNPSIPTSASA
ncbi:Intradiol ring-cleavage dioxygenase [Aspergillus welwitschiae]|uniref:Intradiol ring-cleavage dioxygenase n=1 Tax=Aspergillus welwitschiae TaxID=1341132 RepID=A0A3F3Q0S3_9EURO|nr:Intradiol ring-cleavage dioxygenase [Aspergillus welwitschiae]RDH32748.1 Intradiol ring-cleavage dioxygenase [Aspergillus welwitschiae]